MSVSVQRGSVDTMSDETPISVPEEPLMALLSHEAAQLPATRPEAGALAVIEEFQPSPRQREFQGLAVECEESGQGYVRDWMLASVKKGTDTPVTMKEWRAWMKQAGFAAWFYDSFPLPRKMSKEDVDGLDVVFWQKLREMMTDGDSKALDLYAKVTGKVGQKEDPDNQESAVVEWLAIHGGAVAWRNGGR